MSLDLYNSNHLTTSKGGRTLKLNPYAEEEESQHPNFDPIKMLFFKYLFINISTTLQMPNNFTFSEITSWSLLPG